MKALGIYLLQLIAASGILYGYYHLFLKNKKFHQYNRYYLLASIIISILVPFLQIPFYFTQEETDASALLKALKTIYYSDGDAVVVTASSGYKFNWNIIFFSIYGIIAIVFLGKIILSIWKVKQIIKTHPSEDLEGVHFVNTTEPGTPFSFFKWLFWNKDIELDSEKGQQIFRHEIFHIQQKHSWDVLFAECVSTFLWINPFFHFIKKEIRAIHEFLADEFATKEEDKWEYAELLLMQALQTKQNLVTPFFHNQIKRRIAMITNSQKTSHRYLRKLLALPLTVLVVLLLAFTYKNKNIDGKIISVNHSGMISTSSDEKVNSNYNEVINILAGEIKNEATLVKKPVVTDTTENPLSKNVVNGIVIRSASSYDTSKQPLVIVNGEKLPKTTDLRMLNPDNIESITVLKDKSATSQYGTDGADGAILITTKDNAPLKINNVPVDSASSLNKLNEVVVTGYGITPDNNKVTKQAEQPELKEVVVVGYGTSKPANSNNESKPNNPELKEVVVVGYGTSKPANSNDEAKPNNPELKEVEVVGYGTAKPQINNLAVIYPNPSTNKVQLQFDATVAGKGDIRVTDMNGNAKITTQVGLTKGKNNVFVNVSALAQGTYIISLKGAGADKTAVYKMVKQ